MNLLESVKYSQAWTLPLGDEFWYSEYYGPFEKDGKTYDINKDTANDDPIMLASIEEKQADWEQQADACWHSNHSSVYDSKTGTLHLVIREQFDKVYEFTLDD